jgi:hypothetical protein
MSCSIGVYWWLILGIVWVNIARGFSRKTGGGFWVEFLFCSFHAWQRKQFFFAKKNQKTIEIKALAVPERATQWAKVFASFFKKKCFLITAEPSLAP